MDERRNRNSYQVKEEEEKKHNSHRLQKVFSVEWTVEC